MHSFLNPSLPLCLLLAAAALLRLGVLIVQGERLQEDRDAYLAIARNLAEARGYSLGEEPQPTAFRPPLYPFLLAGLERLGGGWRSLGALHLLLGAAAVWLTWAAGRYLQLGRAAYAAAALVALDPLLLQYTTFAMTETVFTCLTAALLLLTAREIGRTIETTPTTAPRSVGWTILSVKENDANAEGANPSTGDPKQDNPVDVGQDCPTYGREGADQGVGQDCPTYGREGADQDVGQDCPTYMPLNAQIALGVVFGLCGLCRPTIWAFGLLLVAWWGWRNVSSAGSRVRGPGSGRRTVSSAGGTLRPISAALARAVRRLGAAVWCYRTLLLALAVTVSPWAVRNLVVLESPIVTTTHGGYTLLLGNNPVFYREVVMQPLGTVWDGDSLEAWTQSLEAAMRAEGVRGEVERDRWMSRRAWRHIFDEPSLFLRACALRLYRFWNIVPQGPAAEGAGRIVTWSVGTFYALVMAGMLAGLWHLFRSGQLSRWTPILLLLLSFTLVHLLYWSNTRMRAPLVPAVALLAAVGINWGVPLDRMPTKNNDGP